MKALDEAWIGLRLLRTYLKIKVKDLVVKGIPEEKAKISIEEEYTRNPLNARELKKEIERCTR